MIYPNYTLRRTRKGGEDAVRILMEGEDIGTFTLFELDSEVIKGRENEEGGYFQFVFNKATSFLIEERSL